MADSPLSEINWDDLEGQSLITAVNLLQLAFAERVNMADLLGARGFSPSDRGVLRQFPFADNFPITGKPTWPASWPFYKPIRGWDQALENYLSQTKLSAILNTTHTDIAALRFDDFSQDEDTLLTDLGIPLTGNRNTEYPRMDIITTENVKFWYDAITSLKSIFVDQSIGGSGSNFNPKFLSSYSEGIYRPDGSVEFPKNHFIQQYDLYYGTIYGPPFAQLPAEWANLWTGREAKQLITGSLPNWRVKYDYTSAEQPILAAMNTYSRFDTSAFDLLGLSSLPSNIDCYGGYMGGSNKVDGQAWLATNGIVPDKVIQFPDPSRDILAGNMVERNIPIPAPTLPVDGPDIDFNTRTTHFSFENWDYDGGFEFYTPT